MKAKTFRWLVPAVLLALMITYGAYAQSSTSFSMKWSSINGGGGQGLSSTSFRLSGTLGQSVAGTVSSTNFKAFLGFWVSEGAPPTPVASCQAAKILPEGSYVQVTGKIATTDSGDFTGYFYMEEPDRSSGMRVAQSSVTGDVLAKGKTVTVTGNVVTLTTGEREIGNAAVVVATTAPAPKTPLGMINKSLGGGNLGDPVAQLGQYGVSGGTGTNNIGLLVRVWGLVTGSGTDYVTIDDGSGPVRVNTSGAPSVPTSGYALVTGISSLYGTSPNATRLLLAID